jgi:mono/diheme cytochrome c family protein
MRAIIPRSLVSPLVFLIGLYVLQTVRAQSNENSLHTEGSLNASQQSAVERGAYIVHHVAMCVYCHTPKNADGRLDEQQLLHGAPMPVESPFHAPKVAGLPGGWTKDDLVRFLQTGITPTGRTPQPPMPPFRMNDEDAQAVAAYLSSL